MALRAILAKSKLEAKLKTLEALRSKDADFEKREAELATAIEEMTEDTTDKERAEVEKQATAFSEEKEQHEQQKSELETEIEKLEQEIREDEQRTQTLIKDTRNNEKNEKRSGKMTTRKFFKMSSQERDAFFAREDVTDFLQRTRDLAMQKRAVTGTELLIPDVMLELVRENLTDYSKLISKVNLKSIKGTTRQNIMGTVPEAVWTEMLGSLNELTFGFNQVEVDGYKVGGYIVISNITLEDSDITLASEILTNIGQAIGYALDKAILFGLGKNKKMPLGIFTRLAQTAKPADYPAKMREWENLKTSNIQSISANNSVGDKLFKSIVEISGNAKGKYSKGGKFWAMNEKTHTKLLAESVVFNASGAIVAGVNGTMPIVGGDIVELDFVPDNVIIGGYGDLYLLCERAGINIAQSEHARFLEEQTVFRGTARYDGLPVIAEAFVAIGINGATPTATGVTFAVDEANA